MEHNLRWALAFFVLVGLSMFTVVSAAQERATRKDIPSAPLPAAVTRAKKAFLLNGQTSAQYLTKNGNALAFDTLYADMKSWGKYELTDAPAGADIVIELQYRPYSEGSRSYGVYNPSTKSVQTRTRDVIGADFALVIYEATSKEQLWSATDKVGLARTVKNQQKEVIKSIDRLTADLKSRTAP